METIYPKSNNQGSIGKTNGSTVVRSWLYGCFKYLFLNGIKYLFPAADGTSGQVLATNGSGVLSWAAAGAATAWDDIGDPDAAGTIAFAGYKQIMSSTLNSAGAVFTYTNTTADLTADVSFMDFKYTDDGDANGFYLRGYDNATDLQWYIGVNGIFYGVAGFTTPGTVTATAGLSAGSASTSYLKTDTVAISNADIKALRASPKELVATPGAGKWLEFVSAELILDYGSNVLTESSDDLVIEYGTSGVDASATVTANGFITSNADIIAYVPPKAIGAVISASLANNNLQLKNTGDGEYGGNAGADTVMTAKITYRVHATGL